MRTTWTRRTLLAALAGPVLLPSARAQGPTPADPLSPVWAHDLPRVADLALTPDGERMLVLTRDRRLQCFNAGGDLLWNRVAEHADRVVASREGRVILLYSARSAVHREVVVLNGQGDRLGAMMLNEPVQTARVAPDGRHVAIAAGGSVVLCFPERGGLRHRVLPVRGIPVQLQSGPGHALYLATRQPNGVCRLEPTGQTAWQRTETGSGAYSIAASEDGQWLAVAYEAPRERIRVQLIDAGNRRRWGVTREGRGPHVRISPSGGAVMLTYEHRVEYNRQALYERRVCYLGAETGEGWKNGGAFTAPVSVAIHPDGEWVVALDARWRDRKPRLRLFGRSGEIRWTYDCPTDVLLATASQDGRSIALYRADEVVELIRVNQP